MNKQEINTFIETMEKIGDIWTPELVNDLFGSMPLEDALKERQSHLEKFVHTIFSFLKKTKNKNGFCFIQFPFLLLYNLKINFVLLRICQLLLLPQQILLRQR